MRASVRSRLASMVLALLGMGAASLLPGVGQAIATPVGYTAGHADIGVAYEDGELFLHYHFGDGAILDGIATSGDREFDPADAYVRVPGSLSLSRPSDSKWSFLGVPAGETLWYLPQSNVTGAPYLGVAAEDLDASDWAGAQIVYSLVNVAGPGEVSIWQNGSFGNPTVKMATSDGITAADSLIVSTPSHAHYNFGFTAEGIYQVTLTATGTQVTDGPMTDTAVFTFLVGDDTNWPAVPEPATMIAALIGTACMVTARALRGRFKPAT